MITEYKIFPETPLCPNCKNAMNVSDVIPTMATTGLGQDEVIYECRKRRAEVKQILDRQHIEPIVLGQ